MLFYALARPARRVAAVTLTAQGFGFQTDPLPEFETDVATIEDAGFSGGGAEAPDARLTTATAVYARCCGYLRNGIELVIADVVTSRSANLHEELFGVPEAKGRGTDWESPTGLYAVAYRFGSNRCGDKPR